MRAVLVALNCKAHTMIPPIGLGYIATNARNRGHEVHIVDMAKLDLDAPGGVDEVLRLDPDIVGVSIMSTAYGPAKAFTRELRSRRPAIAIAVGGAHVTALPERSLDDFSADYAFIGESEHAFPDLLDRLDAGGSLEKVPSLCFRDGEETATTPRADFFTDLDSLGFPAWDLMDPRTYPDMPNQLLHKRFPTAPMVSTRGCAYDCTFCASTILWGKRLRTRSPMNVVDEIELLVREYGVREIHFEDDNFTLKRRHAKEVCEEILRRDLDLVWSCASGVRVDSLDDDLLELMHEAGCYSVGLGIETGSQELLNRHGKRLDLSKVYDQVRMIKSHGIATHGFFIIGLPGENERTIKETYRFSRKVPFDRANFTLLTPLPGTEIFRDYVEGDPDGKGLDFETYNFFTPFPLDGMDAGDLRRWLRWAVIGFYFRPKPIMHVLSMLKLNQTGKAFRAFLDYVT